MAENDDRKSETDGGSGSDHIGDVGGDTDGDSDLDLIGDIGGAGDTDSDREKRLLRDSDAGGPDLDAVRPPSPWRRLTSARTLASLAIAVALIGVTLWLQDPGTLRDAREMLSSAHLGWYAAALATYYLSFPIRAFRWRLLLENSSEDAQRLPSNAVLAEIIYLSWFINTLVPAKLGDAYRGWLLRRTGGVRFSRGMGTVVAERALDMIVLVIFMVSTGFLTYGDVLALGVEGGLRECLSGGVVGAGEAVDTGGAVVTGGGTGALGCTLARLFALGAALVVVLFLGMLALARWGVHVERLLPDRLAALYSHFAESLVLSFGRFPTLGALSILAWTAEGASFWMTGRALGLELGPALVIFFSLLQAFITVIPATPGGLGFEFVLIGAISLRGFDASAAIALTLLYRTISYLSLLVGGAIVFVLSPRTK